MKNKQTTTKQRIVAATGLSVNDPIAQLTIVKVFLAFSNHCDCLRICFIRDSTRAKYRICCCMSTTISFHQMIYLQMNLRRNDCRLFRSVRQNNQKIWVGVSQACKDPYREKIGIVNEEDENKLTKKPLFRIINVFDVRFAT